MLTHSVVRRISFLLAAAALAAATGCVHVSQRAWYNGQAMSSSWQYRSVMFGDVNPSTLRGTYYSSNALNIGHRSVAYPGFGHW